MEKEQFERRKKVINDLMHDKTYVPMKIKELAMVLGVSREKRGELEAVLDELVSEGKIEVSKRGKYQIAKSHLLTGKYTAHVKGFGFVEIEGQEEDIFIPEEGSGGAFEGDTVQVAVTPGRTGRRREGKIVRCWSGALPNSSVPTSSRRITALWCRTISNFPGIFLSPLKNQKER